MSPGTQAAPKTAPPQASQRPLAVLVTGPNSALGRALVRYLYYDEQIRFVLAVGVEPRPYLFDEFDAKRFHYSRTDITRERDLKNLFYGDLFKDVSIDAIVHLALRNRPDERDPERAHRLNLHGTRNMLDLATESDSVHKFIFRSSHAVYRADPMNPVYLDEEADLNFDTDASRWARDRVDMDLMCRTRIDDPRLNVVVLRFSNIVGRGLHQYMNMYLSSRLPMHPMGFDPMVNLLHPRDAVRAIQLALAKRDLRGVFNIPGKETGPLSVLARINGHKSIGLPGGRLLRAAWRLQRALRMTDFYYEVDPNRLLYPILMDGTRARLVLGYEPLNHVELG